MPFPTARPNLPSPCRTPCLHQPDRFSFSSEQHLLCGKKLAMVKHYRLPSPRPRQYNDFRYH
ncbi:hypothetical protein AL485_24795 [Serratia liquefaciens]|nr:hypothetical protein AL485_24795 [Serratia liquefaciens]PVD45350.1 hypothetical protein C5188_13300 [Serratia liquefaciens]HCR64350.1 hypothetical protein [Serratia liquefaciens]